MSTDTMDLSIDSLIKKVAPEIQAFNDQIRKASNDIKQMEQFLSANVGVVCNFTVFTDGWTEREYEFRWQKYGRQGFRLLLVTLRKDAYGAYTRLEDCRPLADTPSRLRIELAEHLPRFLDVLVDSLRWRTVDPPPATSVAVEDGPGLDDIPF